MSERAPYSRIYWSVVDDPKFADVVDDDRAWALWTRLLMAADQSWPASPMLPLSTNRKALDKLTTAGIVDLQTGGRYRIHGLDAERDRRKEAATRRLPTASQLGPKREPVASRTTGLRRDETRRAETSIASVVAPDLPDDGRPDLEAFLAVRFRAPTKGQRDVMDAYVRVFDITGPQRAADLILRNPDDPIGALMADLKAFREQRVAEAQQAERPAPVRRRKPSSFTGINAELQKLLGEQYAEQERAYSHETGQHQASPDDACALCRGDAA